MRRRSVSLSASLCVAISSSVSALSSVRRRSGAMLSMRCQSMSDKISWWMRVLMSSRRTPGVLGVGGGGWRRDEGGGRSQSPYVGRVSGLDERRAQQRGGVTGVFKLVAQVRVQTFLLWGAARQAVGEPFRRFAR
jgi:hypothetical protein